MNDYDIIFIGPILLHGRSERGGDTMKNRILYDRLCCVFHAVYAVDTYQWQRHPSIFIRLLYVLLRRRYANVIISANTQSANKLIRFIRPLSGKRKVFYWVIGGAFPKQIADGRLRAEDYAYLSNIFVEGQSMVDVLKQCNLTNVVYCPNFKKISHIGERKSVSDGKTHFVFLSRIEESKGTTAIIDCIDRLNAAGYKERYDVTFYGSPSSDLKYRQRFEDLVERYDNAEYRGLLNLKDASNYDILANYDVFLFPTYWAGEGFPGVIIDAYIAGLPIIASDWNLNSEIIQHNKTGWIIPPKDNKQLASMMIYAIEHSETVKEMSANCRALATCFDSDIVLSEEKLFMWGLL